MTRESDERDRELAQLVKPTPKAFMWRTGPKESYEYHFSHRYPSPRPPDHIRVKTLFNGHDLVQAYADGRDSRGSVKNQRDAYDEFNSWRAVLLDVREVECVDFIGHDYQPLNFQMICQDCGHISKEEIRP